MAHAAEHTGAAPRFVVHDAAEGGEGSGEGSGEGGGEGGGGDKPCTNHTIRLLGVEAHDSTVKSRATYELAGRSVAPTARQSPVPASVSVPAVASHTKFCRGAASSHTGTSILEPAVDDRASKQWPSANARPMMAPFCGSNSWSVPPPALPPVGLQECACAFSNRTGFHPRRSMQKP